jgi:hypothetical protein
VAATVSTLSKRYLAVDGKNVTFAEMAAEDFSSGTAEGCA